MLGAVSYTHLDVYKRQEGAEDGSEAGDDEVDDFLDCFFFHCC